MYKMDQLFSSVGLHKKQTKKNPVYFSNMHINGELLISFVSHNDLPEPLKLSTITTAY